MRIAVEDAEGQLTELVRLARQGEEIVLTQDGLATVRLEPMKKTMTREEKASLFDRIQKRARDKNLRSGPDAARSQDFLYDELGLPK